MKQIYVYAVISVWLCIVAISCMNKEESVTYVKPGVYYVGMDISTIPNSVTRGYDANYYQFDENYDPNVIYLHSKEIEGGTVNSIEIPVYNNCPDNQGETCKGFRYRIEVDENQNATITPLDLNGDPIGTSTLTLKQNQTCYFSSMQDDEWKLKDEQVQTNSLYGNPYTFYLRQKDINKEIYRSKSEADGTDLGIDDLLVNGDLTIVRACAGFNTLAFFFDSKSTSLFDDTAFESIMGSDPSTWYVKVYMGGAGFTNAYDLSTQASTGEKAGGYYSTGDAGHFEEGELDLNKYLSFREFMYAFTFSNIKNGFGYLTLEGNQLYTPVVGGENQIEVYILIKHWTGDATGPDDDWLLDDMGALQTKVDFKVEPQNNNFYTLGLTIDINDFKAAWDAAGGDGDATPPSEVAITRSPSGTLVREFTLENAKVICDVY